MALGQGRARAYLATSLPGQQSHTLVVSLTTGEQLPAPKFLDIGHVVPVPSASHQGLQRIHSGAGEGREQQEAIATPCHLSAHPDLPEGLWGRDSPWGHRLTL